MYSTNRQEAPQKNNSKNEDNKDNYLAILELRNTPIPGVGLSPPSVSHGCCTRSVIPFKNTLLKPMNYDPSESSESVERKTASSEEVF